MGSDFKKNLIKVVSGSLVAQVIPFIFAPVLSRIYTPEEFGYLGISLALISLLSVFLSFKYEQAILLPSKITEAKKVTSLSLHCLIISLVVVSVFCLCYDQEIANLVGLGEQKWLIQILPFVLLVNGLYQILSVVAIREKEFTVVATNKVTMSLGNNFAKLGLGKLNYTSSGLIVGYFTGQLLGLLQMVRNKGIRSYLNLERCSILEIVKKYRNFPQFDAPSALANTASQQAPVLLIGKYFGGDILGYYSMMQRLLLAPLNLISRSTLEVFKQRATEDYNNRGNCIVIYRKVLISLVLLGIVPSTVLFFFGSEIFSIYLGEEWVVAGEIAAIFAPALYLKFIVSPLSFTFYLANKQSIDLRIQLVFALLTVLIVVASALYFDYKIMILCISLLHSMLYLIYLFLSYNYARGNGE